jgi:hypothetical protein
MSDGGNGVTSSAIALRVKVVAMFDRTHNPFEETHWVSGLRGCDLARSRNRVGANPTQVTASHGPGIEPCSQWGNSLIDA